MFADIKLTVSGWDTSSSQTLAASKRALMRSLASHSAGPLSTWRQRFSTDLGKFFVVFSVFLTGGLTFKYFPIHTSEFRPTWGRNFWLKPLIPSLSLLYCNFPNYLCLNPFSRHGKEVDWWSFGILIHDMLTGAPPFTGNNRKIITDRVLKGKLQLKNYLTPNAKDILKKLLSRQVEKRLGFGEKDAVALKEHRFFSGVKWSDVLERKTQPPFLPVLKSPDDVSNFDDEFTSKPAIDSPPGMKENLFSKIDPQPFSVLRTSTESQCRRRLPGLQLRRRYRA